MQPIAQHYKDRVIKLWKEGFAKTHISKITRVSLRSVARIVKSWEQTKEGQNFSRESRNRRY